MDKNVGLCLCMLNINVPFRSSSSVFLLKMTSLKMLQLLNRRVSSDDLTQRRRIHFNKNPVILHFKGEIKYCNDPKTELKWGSEYWTSSVFKWSIRGWIIGWQMGWHSNAIWIVDSLTIWIVDSLTIWIPDKWTPSCFLFSYVLARYSNVRSST